MTSKPRYQTHQMLLILTKKAQFSCDYHNTKFETI